jgi:hypothetical protein
VKEEFHFIRRNSMKRASFLVAMVAVVLGLGLAVLSVPSVMANDNDREGPNVIKPDSVAFGRTYSEWSAAWWQWTFSIPVASHPLFDNADCSTGQSGPVWFLGGKFCQTGQMCTGAATRSCSVPAGKGLFFPILNVEDSAPEEPAFGCGDNLPPLKGGTIAEMRQCVESFLSGINNLKAEVDGRSIRNLQRDFRVRSLEFEVTWPEDNVLNAIGEGPFAAGTYSPVVDDGIYVMLPPLSPGHHTLHFQGSFSNGFTENITYNLVVAK